MKIKSIRFKTSVLGTCILGVVLISFSIYLVHSLEQILYKEEEEELLVKAQEINSFIDAYAKISQDNESPSAATMFYRFLGGNILNDKKIIDQLWEKESQALGLKRDFYRIRDLKGNVILGSKNLTFAAQRSFNAHFTRPDNTTYFSYVSINGVPFYGINYPMTFAKLNTLNLQLVMPSTYIEMILHKLIYAIIGDIVVVLLISIFVGSYLTRRVLRPVQEVTRVANHITQSNLNMRIPTKEWDKEMEELVKSFNQMIERLGSSFAYINDFNSHVAHEMKTPLAIIKSELELALSTEGTKEEDKQVIKDTLQEVNRLIKIIKDLLLLAKYEYKLEIFKMEKMDLTVFLKEICQHSKVLAEEKKIKLELSIKDGPLWIVGDATHLRRVFFNLIHNAVKFTPADGDIQVQAEVHDRQVFVSVKDSGIGIEPENQARIFEKFYRIRLVEAEIVDGNGLGLSMARAIARAHKGDITFESELYKGSTFTVSLPLFLN